MRIALFHNLPSGGAKRTVLEQIKRLAERHQVDLYSLSTADHSFCDLTRYVGKVRVRRFVRLPRLSSPLGRLNQGIRTLDILRINSLMRQLANEINSERYDIALVHPCRYTTSPSILRYLNIPSLYYRHDVVRSIHEPQVARPYERAGGFRETVDRVDPLLSSYRWFLEHEDFISMRAATRVVTNSCFVRESLMRLYGTSTSVCYHGVDLDFFSPNGSTRSGFVLSVGMLSARKRFDFLIESIGTIPRNNRPNLIIVSNSRIAGEAAHLRSVAERCGVKIEIRELIDDDKLVGLYRKAIATVYAPMLESFGLVPLESMACATPVVAVREGGVRETVVHEQTGFLVDRDPEAFGKAVLALLGDKTLSLKLGNQARAHVENYWGWDQAIENLEFHLGKATAEA